MKIAISIALLLIGASTVFASPTTEKNTQIVTKLYKDFFEKNDVANMDNYLAKNVTLQKDFNQAIDYASFKKHLLELNQQCVALKMLPFDQILVTGNKVTALYTQRCTDKTGNIHKKRIVAIMEIDSSQKISQVWAVTHEE